MKPASKEKILELKEDGTWDDLAEELEAIYFERWKNSEINAVDHNRMQYQAFKDFMFLIMKVCKEDGRSKDG